MDTLTDCSNDGNHGSHRTGTNNIKADTRRDALTGATGYDKINKPISGASTKRKLEYKPYISYNPPSNLHLMTVTQHEPYHGYPEEIEAMETNEDIYDIIAKVTGFNALTGYTTDSEDMASIAKDIEAAENNEHIDHIIAKVNKFEMASRKKLITKL